MIGFCLKLTNCQAGSHMAILTQYLKSPATVNLSFLRPSMLDFRTGIFLCHSGNKNNLFRKCLPFSLFVHFLSIHFLYTKGRFVLLFTILYFQIISYEDPEICSF